MASPRRGGGGKVELGLWLRDQKLIGFLLHRLHVKSESDWAKTVVCIVSTRSYTQSAKVDLHLKSLFYILPRDPKSIGFLLASSTTYMWSLEVIRQKTSLYPAHKVLYTKCQHWPWPLTPPWPKINRVPPLVFHNLHVKSESDWAKTVVCIVSTRSYTQSAKVDLHLKSLFYILPRDPKSIGFLLASSTTYMWSLEVIRQKTSLYPAHKVLYTKCQRWPWPLTPPPWPKINRVPPLVFHNLHVKSESDWAKTIVCIVSTMYYTQIAKDDFVLWPHDPKSIGFLLSSSTNYMWSLKVIVL